MQILQLEKRLQTQVVVRCALEKALGYRSSSHDITNEISMPKVAFSCLHLMEISGYLLSQINSQCPNHFPHLLSLSFAIIFGKV